MSEPRWSPLPQKPLARASEVHKTSRKRGPEEGDSYWRFERPRSPGTTAECPGALAGFTGCCCVALERSCCFSCPGTSWPPAGGCTLPESGPLTVLAQRLPPRRPSRRAVCHTPAIYSVSLHIIIYLFTVFSPWIVSARRAPPPPVP